MITTFDQSLQPRTRGINLLALSKRSVPDTHRSNANSPGFKHSFGVFVGLGHRLAFGAAPCFAGPVEVLALGPRRHMGAGRTNRAQVARKQGMFGGNLGYFVVGASTGEQVGCKEFGGFLVSKE